jgi:hypothetical protein
MPNVSINGWERHNVVTDSAGRIWSRRGFVVATLANDLVGGSLFVDGFSVRSPTSTEVFHYAFLQDTATNVVTLAVLAENFTTMFTMSLGQMPTAPTFFWAMVNKQLMINSESMASPLYGLPGGGLVPALKVTSENPDTTALDIPTGIICSFGDRMPIAQGSVVYFNDPTIDPRTYVAENTLGLTGQIYDMFQASDGGLYMFTDSGLYIMSSDALGQGQSVVGFVRLVPNVRTLKTRNACPTSFGVVVLTERGCQIIGGPDVEFSTYRGRRKITPNVEVDDMRIFGSVWPVDDGVMVGFGTACDFSVYVDFARGGEVTFIHNEAADGDVEPLHLVGVLTDRDGETVYLTPETARVALLTGGGEMQSYVAGGVPVRAALCGKLDLGPQQTPLLRRVSVSAASAGQAIEAACNGAQHTGLTTATRGDLVADTGELWGTASWADLTARSVRLTLNVRASEPNMEVVCEGADRRVVDNVDVQIAGVWPTRKETEV